MHLKAGTKRLIIVLILGLGQTLVLLWLLGTESTSAANATNLIVTKFTDTNDGSCDADCSLREAVIAANVSNDSDLIILMAGTYVLSIDGSGEDAAATGDLDVVAPVTISGVDPADTIIDGGGIDRIFDIHSGIVVISGVMIYNGDSVIFGGGIHNEASLTLSNSTISENKANSGGGIANRGNGVITITNSAVITNSSSGNGGGIANFSDMILIYSTVSSNTAGVSGGGIINSGGNLEVSRSTVVSNTADSDGWYIKFH